MLCCGVDDHIDQCRYKLISAGKVVLRDFEGSWERGGVMAKAQVSTLGVCWCE